MHLDHACLYNISILCFALFSPFPFLFQGEENLGPWKNEVTQVAVGRETEGTLVLAANRTNRPDILHRFRRYKGGWDIANRHYWAVSARIHFHHFIMFSID